MLTRRTLLATSAAVGVGARFVGAQAATPPGVVVMAKQIDDVISFDPAECTSSPTMRWMATAIAS